MPFRVLGFTVHYFVDVMYSLYSHPDMIAFHFGIGGAYSFGILLIVHLRP